MHIAILITCFNRRERTLDCLKRLSEQIGVEDLKIDIFLVDDGSSDGTSEAVERDFANVHLLKGDGSLYWNGGMRVAFATAMQFDFDGYLWLNDDTLLFPDALQRLVASYRQSKTELGPTILVGSVFDVETGEHTYGGFKKYVHGLRIDFLPVPAIDKASPCDTMNGNFVLIPAEVVARLGNLDGTFTHYMGDIDYGLRATKLQIPIRVAPGYMGTCSHNPTPGTWLDRSLPLRERWKYAASPKGLPIREWFLHTKRHFGWRWPLYAISPYLKLLIGR